MVLHIIGNFVRIYVIEHCAELKIAATESYYTQGTMQGQCSSRQIGSVSGSMRRTRPFVASRVKQPVNVCNLTRIEACRMTAIRRLVPDVIAV